MKCFQDCGFFIRIIVALIRILLADHQALTAAGLISILQKQTDLSVVDQVLIPERTQELLEIHKPDLFIIDYHLPGYITLDVLLLLREAFPQINVLVISSDNDKSTILKVLQAGVTGYLTKECSRDEILMAIHAVARGEKYFCHKILNIIMEKHFSPEPAEILPGILTARETEILKLLASGNSTQKIADELFLSPHTVQTHRKSIIRKLNIKSPTQFVIYAMDMGLIRTK